MTQRTVVIRGKPHNVKRVVKSGMRPLGPVLVLVEPACPTCGAPLKGKGA